MPAKRNNIVPNQHFHKDWQNYVKTWFNQVRVSSLVEQKLGFKNSQELKLIVTFSASQEDPQAPEQGCQGCQGKLVAF